MEQQQMNYQPDYEEISLREMIEALLNGWKIIAIITAICVAISGVYSFYILEPTYEAKATLMASMATDRLTNAQNDSEDVEGILDSISTYPVMTIQTYKEQIKNAKILQKTIEQLGLDKEVFTIRSLRNSIELENIKDTNLIAVKVTNNNPKLAADIANTVAKNFTIFISDMAKDKASKSSRFIENQLEVEKQKLDDALLELKQFLAQPRGVDELEAETTSKLEMLTKYKTQLVEKQIELNKQKSALATATEELQETPEKLVTNKSLASDPLLSQSASQSGLKLEETSNILMEEEEINPLYLKLKNDIAETKVIISGLTNEINNIKDSINKAQKEMETLQVELAEKTHQDKLVQRKVSLAQGTYEAFLNKYEETRIAESSEIGESSILIVGGAVAPQYPTGPKKMLNLAIATVLGLMLGTFIAFFKEYWERTGESVAGSK